MAFKLPKIQLGPKPKRWDFVAALGLLLAAVVAGASLNLVGSQEPGESLTGGLAAAIVCAQLAIAIGSLLVLGKTAKEGTIWGNLAALGGTFAGLGGVLLAAVLWIIA